MKMVLKTHEKFITCHFDHKLCFKKFHKYYTNFQISSHFMAYISNKKWIKVYDLKNQLITSKLKYHVDNILCFIFDQSATRIISLSIDQTIIICKNEKVIFKYKNVAGQFSLQYETYQMKCIGQNHLCYTADDGIFVLKIPKEKGPEEEEKEGPRSPRRRRNSPRRRRPRRRRSARRRSSSRRKRRPRRRSSTVPRIKKTKKKKKQK